MDEMKEAAIPQNVLQYGSFSLEAEIPFALFDFL